jgi:N-methylhydantoinase B
VADPITQEVVRGSLRAIAQEMKIAVMRTAYSPVVASGGDMSAGIADRRGRVVAQGRDIPAQLGALPSSFDAMLEHWLGRLEPGDVLIGNDPYLCGSNHVNDITLIMPAFAATGELLGHLCTRTHWMDIGGATPGAFNARVADMYAEGLRIPTLLAYRNHEPIEEIWELIFTNVRGRTEREWDLRAGFAGCATGARGLERLAARFGADTLIEVMDESIAYTENLVRSRIRAVPDGSYSADDWLEGDGWTNDPVYARVTITVDGDELEMDWAGTGPQVRGGVNLPLSATKGVGIYALKAVLAPDIPPNAGMWAPLTVTAPEGCFVNPLPPAPTQSGEPIQRCADLLMMCLAQAVPEQVMAGTFGSFAILIVEGRDPLEWRRRILDRERSVFMDNSPGGMGGRRAGDGASAIKVHTGNARTASIEVFEYSMPVRMLRWERVADTAGPGRFRGGCAVAREWEALDDDVVATLMAERAVVPPFGLLGGGVGACATYAVDAGTEDEQLLPSKADQVHLRRGSRFLMQGAAGGGYGPAWERPVEAVQEDVLDGYVTRARAREDYGVAIAEDGTVDTAETERLRADLAVPHPPPLIDRGSWRLGDVSIGEEHTDAARYAATVNLPACENRRHLERRSGQR